MEYPEEVRQDNIQYTLRKYLNNNKLFEMFFQISDAKLEELLNHITDNRENWRNKNG